MPAVKPTWGQLLRCAAPLCIPRVAKPAAVLESPLYNTRVRLLPLYIVQMHYLLGALLIERAM